MTSLHTVIQLQAFGVGSNPGSYVYFVHYQCLQRSCVHNTQISYTKFRFIQLFTLNKVFLTEEMFGVKLVCKSSHQILFRTQKEAAGDSQLVCERRGGSTGPSLGPPWCPCPRCCCWPPARSSPPSPSPSCARARPSSWRRRAARPSWSAGSPTSPPTTW